MLKGMKKYEDKEHGKTFKHEAPRCINQKTTQNKNNTGTTALVTVSSIIHRRVKLNPKIIKNISIKCLTCNNEMAIRYSGFLGL